MEVTKWLVRQESWRVPTGANEGSTRPVSECCDVRGDDHDEAYTAIVRGVGLSHDTRKIAGGRGSQTC
jgi:hypothetical protein